MWHIHIVLQYYTLSKRDSPFFSHIYQTQQAFHRFQPHISVFMIPKTVDRTNLETEYAQNSPLNPA